MMDRKMVREVLPRALFLCLLTAYLCHGQEVNVALNQTTSQQENLVYLGLNWTSDKAVDGCTNGSDPNTDGCCSSSVGEANTNNLRVDLDKEYSVNRIVVIGRTDGSEDQLTDFQLHILNATGTVPEMIYDNNGVAYGDGVFTVDANGTLVKYVIVTRVATTLTLCEVEVYADVTTTDVTTTVRTPVTTDPGNSAGPVTTTTLLYHFTLAAAVLWNMKLT